MSASAARVCDALFMGDSREYEGPFVRGLAGSAADMYAQAANTDRYQRFIREKVVAAVLRNMDGAGRRDNMVDRICSTAIRLAKDMTPISTSDGLNFAIKQDPEWREFQRERILRVATMCNRDLSDADIDVLMGSDASDLDGLREAIDRLSVIDDEFPYVDDVDDDYDDQEDEGDQVTELPVVKPTVDEAWLEAFEKAYGREAFVHEYVLLRNVIVDIPPEVMYKKHVDAYTALSDMHRSYLDEHLTESAFVRKFVPQVFIDSTVVDQHLDELLNSADYRNNMCRRLSTIHRALFGEPLTEVESAYLFSKRVLAERLTLQCERLNELIMEFAGETAQLGQVIADCYGECIDRLPDSWEIKECLSDFRGNTESATADLRRRLKASLEFQDLLKRTIQARAPDYTQGQVFKALSEVLKMDVTRHSADELVDLLFSNK